MRLLTKKRRKSQHARELRLNNFVICLNSNVKSNKVTAEGSKIVRQASSGFDLPSVDSIERSPIRSPGSSGSLIDKKGYSPADTKKSLVSVGKSVVDSNAYSIYNKSRGRKLESIGYLF